MTLNPAAGSKILSGSYGEGIATTGGFSISKQTLAYLPEVVASTNGTDTVPNVSGATFKACEYNDAFMQH